MKKLVCSVVFGMLISITANAVSPKVSEPATKKNLVGTWDLVSVKPVHDKKDPAFYPYQRYVFNSDSSMKFMVSDAPFNKEWVDKFKKQPNEINYTVSEKGILTLTWSNKPFTESVVAAYVVQDMPKEVIERLPVFEKAKLPRRGNIVLSFLNKSGKIAYQKVFSRVS